MTSNIEFTSNSAVADAPAANTGTTTMVNADKQAVVASHVADPTDVVPITASNSTNSAATELPTASFATTTSAAAATTTADPTSSTTASLAASIPSATSATSSTATIASAASTTISSVPITPGSTTRIPIVYDAGYNISLWGLEQYLHAFDGRKYAKVFQHLRSLGFTSEQFHRPTMPERSQLLRVHTEEYLHELEASPSTTFARISEVPLVAILPPCVSRSHFIEPVKLATGGTVLAAQLACTHGWSINLGGGFHHAFRDHGEGFCALADIPLAAYTVLDTNPTWRILIVDLDAHQGNGVEGVIQRHPSIRILDMYNARIFPRDHDAARHIEYRVLLEPGTMTDVYLSRLRRAFLEALAEYRPNFIIYNAGTDIYEDDPLGALSVSADGIRQRDAFVFHEARSRNIPIMMVLSGGYTPASAGIISTSIENLLRTELGVLR